MAHVRVIAGLRDVDGCQGAQKPLITDPHHNFAAMNARIGANTKSVFVCNPNIPTAVLDHQTTMRHFVSMTVLVTADHNIFVSRAASKIHSLVGLRIGFAVARPDVIKQMAQFATGNRCTFGVRAALASVQDTGYQTFVKASNCEGRAMRTTALTKAGRRIAPSQTNFVFLHPGRPVEQLRNHFLTNGFRAGRASHSYGDWCQVSIGAPDEMKQFVQLIPGA